MKYIIVLLFAVLGFSSVSAQSTVPAPVAKERHYCGATTSTGGACKQLVKTKGGKCRFHSPNKIVCGALTSKKTPCQSVVASKDKRCWRHAKN